jgi:hypothetical protein
MRSPGQHRSIAAVRTNRPGHYLVDNLNIELGFLCVWVSSLITQRRTRTAAPLR